MLWNKIPTSYKGGLCPTDFYASYKSVLPKEQHPPGAKKEGRTNHIERFFSHSKPALATFALDHHTRQFFHPGEWESQGKRIRN